MTTDRGTADGGTADGLAESLRAALDAGAPPPVVPGVDGVVRLSIPGPAGEASLTVRFVDGVAGPAGADDAPAVTLTLPSAEAAAVAAGALDPSVAFMRGRLKTSGDEGIVLRLLAAAARPDFGAWMAGRRSDGGGS